jgi:ATP-dependent Clp protease adaptor protein ClpS
MGDNSGSFEYESTIAVAIPEVDERERPARGKDKPQHGRQPPYNVVIWNDDDHTHAYVIELLMELFAHSYEQALKIADTVDRVGRAIAFTTHKELAELKRDQILEAGADWRVEECAGPMSATIEPVE